MIETLLLCWFCHEMPACYYADPPCPTFLGPCYLARCQKMHDGKPPVGCHSHLTHYNITYSDEDLRYNKTKSDVRNWLNEVKI
jgi:hypothetical protein